MSLKFEKTFPWLKDIEKNLIHEWSDSMVDEDISDNEIINLREELSITHKTYRKELNSLKELIDLKELRIREYFDRIVCLEILREKMNDNLDELNLKCTLLIKSREDWLGRSLKLHYLLKEMDKIGLKQSDDIFEAYKDIEMPIHQIPLQIREKYIPTILTNVVEEDSGDEEL